MNQESIYRVCVKALVKDGDSILLARESSGVWDLLGGGIEAKESPEECLSREIMEETAIGIEYISPQPTYFFTAVSNKGTPVANVVYETGLESLNLRPSGECEELRFFTIDESKQVELSPSAQKLFELLS